MTERFKHLAGMYVENRLDAAGQEELRAYLSDPECREYLDRLLEEGKREEEGKRKKEKGKSEERQEGPRKKEKGKREEKTPTAGKSPNQQITKSPIKRGDSRLE